MAAATVTANQAPAEMEASSSSYSLRSISRMLLATGTGRTAILLFIVMALISAYVIAFYPNNFGPGYWSNPTVWADNPKTVPPAWTVWLGNDAAEHKASTLYAPTQVKVPEQAGAVKEIRYYEVAYQVDGTTTPSMLVTTLEQVVFAERPPAVLVSLIRPDGGQIRLGAITIAGPRPGESSPYQRFFDTPERVLLTQQETAATALLQFYEKAYPDRTLPPDLADRLDSALFSVPATDGSGHLVTLQGDYVLQVQVLVANVDDGVGIVSSVFGGTVFGWMGTDSIGRDLWEGLLFGFPVALIIATVAAVLITLIGATLGIISGYAGGRTDAVIQRICDVISNVPTLPLLIFIVFVFGANLALILIALVAFSWTGLTILVRSMVLQIRSGQLVEAAKALGASRRRIMTRHVFPQVAPYIVAQMIFTAPGAILAESSLSFLGLGDPSIPTWGQMLQSGFQTGALYVGDWWLVVPPGVLIILTAVAFMLLALAVEPIVDPRLRKTT